MRRTLVRMEDVIAWPNLLLAVRKAVRGKRQRADVRAFVADLDGSLQRLAQSIVDGSAPVNSYRSFRIHDPKPRLIHAACLEDRVLHHALMNVCGPAFERALGDGVHACRPGKGVHRAVAAAQRNLQRYRYYAKVDIDAYFPSIAHVKLKQMLEGMFKGAWFLALFARIIDGCHARPGYGLPIGSLTSQYCANHYLASADRLLLAQPGVLAHLRYMDDILWWGEDKTVLRRSLDALHAHVQTLGLRLKPSSIQIQRSEHGVAWCGYRIRQGDILPSRRKQRRYAQQMRALIACCAQGDFIAAPSALQRRAEAIDAALAHCTASRFRQDFWRRHGGPGASGLDWLGASA